MRRRHRKSSAYLTSVRPRHPAMGRILAVPALAAGLLLASQSPVARQDLTGLLLASLEGGGHWAVAIGEGPGGVSALYTEPLADMAAPASATVTIGGQAYVVEGVDPIVTGAINAPALVPDEERIDRSWKGDLPATITTPATAPGFSAGSIFPEHSRLAPPDPAAMPAMAFSTSDTPLSALAVARFIAPKPATTAVAELEPVPVPPNRPDVTLLVASSYPARALPAGEANDTAAAMVSAYAPDASVVSQDVFAALFALPPDKPAVPPSAMAPGDHWWAKLTLPDTIYSAREQECLAEAVYFEARSEPYKGQVAVAQVVLNRVKNPAYPDTICKVVYQNKDWTNACQFSFACDGIRDVVHARKAWALARKVANDVSFKGVWLEEVGSSTHYHATYVRPAWAGVFKKKAKIGLHVFYQTIHGGWS